MSRPESIFCQILQVQYNTAIDNIESVVYLPLRVLRDVKSNIGRVERLVYTAVKTEVERIEAQVIEILFLNSVRLIEGSENFCRVAFSCTALVDALVEADYGDFIPNDIRNQISSNYELFEKHVCILGLRNLISSFVDSILASLRSRLIALRSMMEDQLRLNELVALYETALTENILGNYSIIELIDILRKFLNCAFYTCDWASTASNKIADYTKKLALSDNGTTFSQNISSLLTNYYDLNDEINTKIDEIVLMIDNRRTKGIRKDETMIF